MPIIVLEGPDGSGKTTLAEDLQNRLGEVWSEVELLKSPIKEHGWSDAYSHYLRDRTNLLEGMIGIQDRTPEISESVYGIMRSNPRGRGWGYELYGWVDQPIFFIFCQNLDKYLRGSHKDAEGNIMQDNDLSQMRLLYDQVYFNMHQVVINAHPHGMRVHYYHWKEGSERVRFFLAEWLSWQWPSKAYDIEEALG